MKLRRLSNDVYAADQVAPGDVERLAALGFRSLLNNRPDGESEDQPSAAAIGDAAAAAGLAYAHVPIVTREMSDAEALEFSRAAADLPAPVCAFCRTGTRSMTAWALGQLGRCATYEIVEAVEGAGFESEDLKVQLASKLNGAAAAS